MEKGAILPILSSQEFFSDLAEPHLEKLAGSASRKTYATEEILFRQDRPADRFFLVVKGEVSVEIPAIYGHPITIQLLRDGDVLGWSWLFAPHRWHFDARATRSTETIVFKAKGLRKACEDDHTFGYEIMKRFGTLMMQRLEAARLKVMEL